MLKIDMDSELYWEKLIDKGFAKVPITYLTGFSSEVCEKRYAYSSNGDFLDWRKYNKNKPIVTIAYFNASSVFIVAGKWIPGYAYKGAEFFDNVVQTPFPAFVKVVETNYIPKQMKAPTVIAQKIILHIGAVPEPAVVSCDCVKKFPDAIIYKLEVV